MDNKQLKEQLHSTVLELDVMHIVFWSCSIMAGTLLAWTRHISTPIPQLVVYIGFLNGLAE